MQPGSDTGVSLLRHCWCSWLDHTNSRKLTATGLNRSMFRQSDVVDLIKSAHCQFLSSQHTWANAHVYLVFLVKHGCFVYWNQAFHHHAFLITQFEKWTFSSILPHKKCFPHHTVWEENLLHIPHISPASSLQLWLLSNPWNCRKWPPGSLTNPS